MAIKPVPSLSLSGFINELRDKSDRLMSYFFYSDASQSNVYLGEVSSLPDIIQKYGNDKDSIATEMDDALQKYLERYFDIVEVEVKINIPENATDNRMEILCEIIVGENGVKYDFAKILNTANGKLTTIMDRNNQGFE